ncbi:MAG TPA: glycosyltransferase [Candidatus Baltobacteraceae bacterium]
MRALVFAHDFPSSENPQAGVFFLRQIHALENIGFKIRVVRVVPHAPPFGGRWSNYRRVPQRYEYEGVQVRTLRAFVPPRNLGCAFVAKQLRPALLREIAEWNADYVHVHTLIPMAAYAIDLPVPVVLTAHGRDTYENPWRRPGLEAAAREALASATAVVCVSDFVRTHVKRLGRDDAFVVYNGADERVFRPRDRRVARERLRLSHTAPVIAFAGNLLRAKGVLDLLEAAKRLGDLKPTLVFAGDGPERIAIEEARTDLQIQLMGIVTQRQIADVFTAADVVVLPSYREGLPATVCEAMASGRAVVATRVGGIPEIVESGRTGKLIEPGDVGALTDALRYLLRDHAERIRMECAAASFASEHLTWRHNAEAYAQIIEGFRKTNTAAMTHCSS